MLYIITGKSGSGKSQKAEDLCVAQKTFHTKLLYIATLDKQSGGDTKKRIEKHQKMREGKGFFVLECPKDLSCAVSFCKDCKKKGENVVCLLEDLNNLLANMLFSPPHYRAGLAKCFFVFFKIKRQISKLQKASCHLVVVMNEAQDEVDKKKQKKTIQRYYLLLQALYAFLKKNIE